MKSYHHYHINITINITVIVICYLHYHYHIREVVLTSVSPMEVAVSSVSGGGVTSSMLSSLPHPLGTGHSDTAAMVTLLPSHINGTH